MTSNDLLDANWGERNVAARNRRRTAMRTVAILIAIGFLAVVQSFVPARAWQLRFGLTAVWYLVALIYCWLEWRSSDELQRRRSVNTFAATGLVTFLLLPIAPAIGMLLGGAKSLTVVLCGAFATTLVAYAVQYFRD